MRTRTEKNIGHSLLELAAAVTVLAMVLGGLYSILGAGRGAVESGMRVGQVEQEVSRSVERVVRELTFAGAASLFPNPAAPFGSASLDYQVNRGYAQGTVEWGTTTRIAFEYDDGELDNGLDDDGDGLVDEGVIVRVTALGTEEELRANIADGVREYLEGEVPNGEDDNGNGLVDERGLSFVREGELLTIRMTLERIGPGGESLLRTLEGSVLLRN